MDLSMRRKLLREKVTINDILKLILLLIGNGYKPRSFTQKLP